MSRILDRAVARAGLGEWLARRLDGRATDDDRARIEAMAGELDLLVLGAIADRVRARERGPVVRLHVDRPPRLDEGEGIGVCAVAGGPTEQGEAFARRVACARLRASAVTAVRVDAEALGLPMAQLALAFGADELVAPVRRLGLEVYAEGEADEDQSVLRERELAALVRAAGREPRIVEWHGHASLERPVDEQSRARRRFRAPGRHLLGGEGAR